MIDTKHIRTIVVKGLKEYLGIPVIRSNQNKKPSKYPYISYTITTPESENKGTFGVYEDGKDRKPVKQTWSVSSLSDDEDVCLENAEKARDWFEYVAHIYLTNNGIIVQSVTAVTNRDNVLTAEYEYKSGFDVVFYIMNEIENRAMKTGEYMEIVDIEKGVK